MSTRPSNAGIYSRQLRSVGFTLEVVQSIARALVAETFAVGAGS